MDDACDVINVFNEEDAIDEVTDGVIDGVTDGVTNGVTNGVIDGIIDKVDSPMLDECTPIVVVMLFMLNDDVDTMLVTDVIIDDIGDDIMP